MAVTIAQVRKSQEGSAKVNYVDITGPASYTTGGEALSQSDLNALVGDVGVKIGDLNHFDAEVTSGGHTLFLDRTNSKILFWNGTTQIANATNLSTFTSRVRVAKVAKP
jgi:hypothetical protein